MSRIVKSEIQKYQKVQDKEYDTEYKARLDAYDEDAKAATAIKEQKLDVACITLLDESCDDL